MPRKSAAAAAPPSPASSATTSADEEESEPIASPAKPAAVSSTEEESGTDEDEAPRHSNRKPAPTVASSEEEESSGDEEEEATPANHTPKPASEEKESSGDEDNEEETAPENHTPKPATPAAASSSSEEESDDDEAPPPPVVKPTATDASESDSTDESEPEPDNQAQPPPTANPASESDSDDESESDNQAPAPPATKPITKAAKAEARSAKTAMGTSESSGMKAFQRICSDEDETAILRGMLDYKIKSGNMPSSGPEMNAVYESIPQIKLSRNQFILKVRRMKKKYETICGKSPSPTFTKPHDAEVYELSLKVWGAKRPVSENGSAGGNANKRQKIVEALEGEIKVNGGDVTAQYPFLTQAISSVRDSLLAGVEVKEAIEFLGESKAIDLEDKYKKLKLQRVRHHLYELSLAKESMKFAMDALGL